MTSIISALWGTAKSSSTDSASRRLSVEERRISIENAEKAEEMRRVVEQGDGKFQPKVQTRTNTNVWQSVFNPGRNMSMQQTTRDYFDHPDDSKATTWDHVLKSEKVKEMTFNQLDKNRDGFITADELKVEMSGSSANVTEMIKQADKNGVSHLL